MKKLTGIILLILISACAKEEFKSSGQLTGEKVIIENPWVRVAGEGMNTGLFFKAINNSDNPDTLISVQSDVAEIVEVHESFTTEDGRKGMQHIDFVEIPSKGFTLFKPMSYHVMLIQLRQDANIGDTVKAVLKFKHSGNIGIIGTVKDMPMPGRMKK